MAEDVQKTHQVHPDQASSDDPNRALEAEQTRQAEERLEREQEARKNRRPDPSDPNVMRGVAVGSYVGGVEVLTSPGLREDSKDAKYVPPRHNASGEWQSSEKSSSKSKTTEK